MTFKNSKDAIRAIFEELYNSANDTYSDILMDAIRYIADEVEANDLLEEMEDYSPEEICVIHKTKAQQLMGEGALEKAYTISNHFNTFNK